MVLPNSLQVENQETTYLADVGSNLNETILCKVEVI